MVDNNDDTVYATYDHNDVYFVSNAHIAQIVAIAEKASQHSSFRQVKTDNVKNIYGAIKISFEKFLEGAIISNICYPCFNIVPEDLSLALNFLKGGDKSTNAYREYLKMQGEFARIVALFALMNRADCFISVTGLPDKKAVNLSVADCTKYQRAMDALFNASGASSYSGSIRQDKIDFENFYVENHGLFRGFYDAGGRPWKAHIPNIMVAKALISMLESGTISNIYWV